MTPTLRPDVSSRLLDVKNLRISFAGKEVVRSIDFSISPGEKLALVGESGSGKTVTALSLLRLVQNGDLQGQAVFAGRDGPSDLLAISEQQLRGIRGQDIAMIFQEPMTALNPLFSVGSQISEILMLKKGLASADAWLDAIKLLADTGIAEPERRAPLQVRKSDGDVDPKDAATWGRVARNAVCPCGSGKKYKHCHGRME